MALSKWTRSQSKKEGVANVHYLRYQRFFVIIAGSSKNPKLFLIEEIVTNKYCVTTDFFGKNLKMSN
jgi:hypothetical protein